MPERQNNLVARTIPRARVVGPGPKALRELEFTFEYLHGICKITNLSNLSGNTHTHTDVYVYMIYMYKIHVYVRTIHTFK